jgi:hypothetical protein
LIWSRESISPKLETASSDEDGPADAEKNDRNMEAHPPGLFVVAAALACKSLIIPILFFPSAI